MTEEPLDYVYELTDWQKELPVRAVIAQVERLSHQHDYLRAVRNADWQPGFSLDLYTPLSAIEDSSWEFLEVVQVMGVPAGFQGQEFKQVALDTVQAVVERTAQLDHPVEIIVDGGIKLEHLDRLQQLQVDGIAIGSALWQAADLSEQLQQFTA